MVKLKFGEGLTERLATRERWSWDYVLALPTPSFPGDSQKLAWGGCQS